MKSSVLKTLLLGVAALPAIAVGAYMLSTRNEHEVQMKQIVFELSRPDDMKRHIKKWLPLVPGDTGTLVGSVEDEPLTISLKHNGLDCSFESILTTVDIDTKLNGRVDEIFIGSKPMTLRHAISSMERILKMLDTKPDKLNKWAKGALTWSKDPTAWPKGTPFPADAWYHEGIRTAETWYALEIRSSADSAKPWRITFRTGPRKFFGAPPAGESKESRPSNG